MAISGKKPKKVLRKLTKQTFPSNVALLKQISDQDALARLVDIQLKNQGFQITKVLQGPIGPKGDRGEKGEKGKEGSTGPQGIRGEQGPQGMDGNAGPSGQVGKAGERGPEGKEGRQGPLGDRGPNGEKGDPGIQGPPPKHEIENDRIRFENPQGTWGEWINLKSVNIRHIGGGGGGISPSAPPGNINASDVVGLEEAIEAASSLNKMILINM